MIRRPPRSTLSSSSAASDVYKRQDVDSFFSWLLHYRPPSCLDVPLLLSAEPFLHSSLTQLDVAYSGAIQKTGLKAVQQQEFCFDLRGQIIPQVMQQVCQVLQETHHDDFEMQLTALKKTDALNECVCSQRFGKKKGEDKSTPVSDAGSVTACTISKGEWNREGKYYAMPVTCLLYTSPSPRDRTRSRMPSSA
eukprot:TRINITY_DN1993_c0_g1_i7.p1 TRINITY_DN1993_c0_g1~~TRINITY_DN1993_c0_g1_i7.p1  ORF type:complete len:193 (-),score=44.84 TRINITY_DN1993_c0_g1_i7:38-616(-)